MNKTPTLSLPGAVVIAGLMIALAVVFTAKPAAPALANPDNQANTDQTDTTALLENMDPVTSEDHIFGNPNASITIVEYSDLDCPFCEKFHTTMEAIIAEYPDDVRWVYRHFPLSFHPQADDEAMVAECVAKLGGNENYWKILKSLLAISSSNSATFETDAIFAETSKLGINTAQLQSCYDSKEFQSRIDNHTENASATGGQGTPWSIIIRPDGQKQAINGAQPHTIVKSIVDEMLQ